MTRYRRMYGTGVRSGVDLTPPDQHDPMEDYADEPDCILERAENYLRERGVSADQAIALARAHYAEEEAAGESGGDLPPFIRNRVRAETGAEHADGGHR